MSDDIIAKLMTVYKPSKEYFGEWDLEVSELKEISLSKNEKNLFDSFLERYYYMALDVIFKNDELVRDFKCGITSRIVNKKRNLFFSKKTFLRNFITNIDEIIDKSGDTIYKVIKKEIRIKKDKYRDVAVLMEKSEYYEEVKNDYLLCNTDLTLEEFIHICKKKYTRLLSGYNAVMDFFDKPIDLKKFINCFDCDQLYLYTLKKILEMNIQYYDLYGRINYNVYCLEEYEEIVAKIRKKHTFYNSLITINGQITTIDDLLKDYHNFIQFINN